MDSRSPSPNLTLQFLEPGFSDDTKPRCTTCGKVFKRMYALERHIVVHDPERARLEHKCPYDGCRFSSLQKSNVKTHVQAVHEKIKHKCTLPCTPQDAYSSNTSQSGRCGRIFSDSPALIRHEKRAHGFYRRGLPARARPKTSKSVVKVAAQPLDIGGSAAHEVRSASTEDLPAQETFEPSPSDEKVQVWLQGSDVRTTAEMNWEESDSVTPCATSFARDGIPNSGMSYAPASVSTSTYTAVPATSVSDVESLTTGSMSSSISTSPSPAPPEPVNHLYAPVATYPTPPAYPQNYYCPYAQYPPVQVQSYDVNRAYSLHPVHYVQSQTQGTIYYDNDNVNPSMEEWLPQLAELKRSMQANGMHSGATEWDGTVTGLSLID